MTAPTKHDHEGIVVHRSRTLQAPDVTERFGIRLTTAARTLLDLAEVLPARQLETAVSEAEVQRLVSHQEIRLLLKRANGRRGVKAAPLVREPEAITRSELEPAGWRVVRFTYRQVQEREEAAAMLRRIYDAA